MTSFIRVYVFDYVKNVDTIVRPSLILQLVILLLENLFPNTRIIGYYF